MIGRAKTILDLLRLLRHGGPAVCNVSVTNTCNAACGFCNFAYDKGYVRDRFHLTPSRIRVRGAFGRAQCSITPGYER
jgi:MoaA/NifB/PqqE/SkfB family radical SAM enzyme